MANHMASCHQVPSKSMPDRMAIDASRRRAGVPRPVPDVLTSLVLPTHLQPLVSNLIDYSTRERAL